MSASTFICPTCSRLKRGLCYGEKNQTACPSYQPLNSADRICAATGQEMSSQYVQHFCLDCGVRFIGTPKARYCQKCRKIRMGAGARISAKERGLCYLGAKARWGK